MPTIRRKQELKDLQGDEVKGNQKAYKMSPPIESVTSGSLNIWLNNLKGLQFLKQRLSLTAKTLLILTIYAAGIKF